MLHMIFSPLGEDVSFFNLFNYLTFRTGGAVVTALLIAFLIGAPLIGWLRKKQGKGQPIREDGPQGHLLTKKGTPTMGGFIILISLGASALLWANLSNPYVWVVLGVTFGYGAIGFVDDFRKVTKQKADGLSSRIRLGLEFAIALVAVVIIMGVHGAQTPDGAAEFGPLQGLGQFLGDWGQTLTRLRNTVGEGFEASVAVPFFKDVLVFLGPFFLLFGMLVIAGAGNAVNLTDGLDGLAIVPVMIAAGCFGIIAYLAGNAVFARYLGIHFTPGTGELAVLMGALLGGSLGFLWYNAPPARIFMGDTGSLALGGLLGAAAVATKHEFALAIIGGLFVLEAMSVMIQVGVFKATKGKTRVFLMAPIHHHFEKLGWAEPTIVIRFWIVATIFALAGLATLKLR